MCDSELRHENVSDMQIVLTFFIKTAITLVFFIILRGNEYYKTENNHTNMILHLYQWFCDLIFWPPVWVLKRYIAELFLADKFQISKPN